jgi:hypothetical protein
MMAATAMVSTTWRRSACRHHCLISSSHHYHERCSAISRRTIANRQLSNSSKSSSDKAITSVMERSTTRTTTQTNFKTANNDITLLQTPATSTFKQRRKRSSLARRNIFVSNYSHPKSYTPLPSSTYKLTRKDILRLTPHQRSILHKHRYTEYIDSLSHLDRARINVRSNVRYLKDRANVGTNLETNIRTLKNLLFGKAKGDEELEVVEIGTQTQNKVRSSGKSSSSSSVQKAEEVEEVGIDWERAPDEIKANIRSNLSVLQNWIHKITDGRIPLAASATNVTSSTENVAGSVANRIRAFHEMKQNQPLVMDNWWIGKNILIALLPGVLIHIYCLSLQDEMKDYFARYEQVEREKLGIGSSRVDGGEEKGMSIISALKPNDEESAWEKMKNVVDDLLFGGAERRIHELQQQAAAQQQSRTKEDDETRKVEVSQTKEVEESNNPSTPNLNDISTVNVVKPDIQALLSRIEALEKQLGTNNNSNGMTSLSDNELRQRQEKERRRLERMQQQQSPIQNRRDASLRAKFNEIDSLRNNIQPINEPDSNNNDTSYFQYLAHFVSLEIATKTMNQIRSMIGLSEEDEIDDHSITMVGVDAVDNECRSNEPMNVSDNLPSIVVCDINEASNKVSRTGRIYRWVSSKWQILRKSSQSDDTDVDGEGK